MLKLSVYDVAENISYSIWAAFNVKRYEVVIKTDSDFEAKIRMHCESITMKIRTEDESCRTF